MIPLIYLIAVMNACIDAYFDSFSDLPSFVSIHETARSTMSSCDDKKYMSFSHERTWFSKSKWKNARIHKIGKIKHITKAERILLD